MMDNNRSWMREVLEICETEDSDPQWHGTRAEYFKLKEIADKVIEYATHDDNYELAVRKYSDLLGVLMGDDVRYFIRIYERSRNVEGGYKLFQIYRRDDGLITKRVVIWKTGMVIHADQRGFPVMQEK